MRISVGTAFFHGKQWLKGVFPRSIHDRYGSRTRILRLASASVTDGQYVCLPSPQTPSHDRLLAPNSRRGHFYLVDGSARSFNWEFIVEYFSAVAKVRPVSSAAEVEKAKKYPSSVVLFHKVSDVCRSHACHLILFSGCRYRARLLLVYWKLPTPGLSRCAVLCTSVEKYRSTS